MKNDSVFEDDGINNISINASLNFVSTFPNGLTDVNVYFGNEISGISELQYLFQDGTEYAFQDDTLYEFNGAA